jgi:hypothetical protein
MTRADAERIAIEPNQTMTRTEAERIATEVGAALGRATPGLNGAPEWAVEVLQRTRRLSRYFIDIESAEWRTFSQYHQEFIDGDLDVVLSDLWELATAAMDDARRGLRVVDTKARAGEAHEQTIARQERAVAAAEKRRVKAVADVDKVLHIWSNAFVTKFTALTAVAEFMLADGKAAQAEKMSARKVPAPAAQEFGVSHFGAEQLVCAWMRHLGWADAEVTRTGADGGIDVESATHVAQVKNYAGSVGVDVVRQIAGVAAAEGKAPLVFTSGSYTVDALAFAERTAVPLFVYDAVAGTLGGANQPGRRLVANGVPEA